MSNHNLVQDMSSDSDYELDDGFEGYQPTENEMNHANYALAKRDATPPEVSSLTNNLILILLRKITKKWVESNTGQTMPPIIGRFLAKFETKPMTNWPHRLNRIVQMFEELAKPENRIYEDLMKSLLMSFRSFFELSFDRRSADYEKNTLDRIVEYCDRFGIVEDPTMVETMKQLYPHLQKQAREQIEKEQKEEKEMEEDLDSPIEVVDLPENVPSTSRKTRVIFKFENRKIAQVDVILDATSPLLRSSSDQAGSNENNDSGIISE